MELKNKSNGTTSGNIMSFDVFEEKSSKTKRKEKKFLGDEESTEDGEESGKGKFKLDPFIDAVTAIKNQLVAQLGECDSRIIAKNNIGGGASSSKYKKVFLDLLERTAALLAEATSEREKGRKLGDEKLVAIFRKDYKGLDTDVAKSIESYNNEKNAEIGDRQSEIKNKDLRALIGTALETLQGANTLLKEYLANQSKKIETPDSGAKDSKASTSTSDVKIEKPIKKWEPGKPANETVKKIQQLIVDKFKNNKDVSSNPVYIAFAKSKPDGKNGKKTSDIVILLKKGFGMKDTTSDLSQEFVNELSALKEGRITESKDILSFDDFISIKKINEAFDAGLFNKAYTEYEAKGKSTNSDKKEGDKKEGDKKEGDKKEGDKKEVSPSKLAEEAYNLFKKASDQIVKLFGDGKFFEEFKGKINDDEKGAMKAFDEWYTSILKAKILNPAKAKLDKLPKGEDADACKKNYDLLISAQSSIKKKLAGNTDDDVFRWKIYPVGEETEVKSYKVDTDF